MNEVTAEEGAPFRPLSLSDRPPVKTPADFQLADGRVVIGWRILDTLLGRSFYWAWTRDAPQATKITSRHDIAGMTPITPVAWRPRPKPIIRAPDEFIPRREAEVLVHRAILTDGTMRSGIVKGVKSTWDDSWHTDPDWERNVGERVGVELATKVKFRPSPRDQQNYENGTVLRWFAALRPANAEVGFSEEQLIVVLCAYDFSYYWIGDKLGRPEQFIKERYDWALDRIWSAALDDSSGVRRLPRHLWATEPV
jgi:hypothetical protein